MKQNLILACLAGAILTACGGKKESEPKVATPASPTAVPATVAAPVTSALPKADASIPLSQYQKAVPEDMVYLYHALSQLSIARCASAITLSCIYSKWHLVVRGPKFWLRDIYFLS